MSAVDRHTIASEVSQQAERYGVRRAYLFGSYARGEADEASDVDICIEPDAGFTLFSLGGFAQRLEDAFGVGVDVVCGEDTFYPRAKARYEKDRVLLYERA